jgi:hypothetical protein
MGLFCVFWVPLVLFLWFSLNSGRSGNSGGVWALIFGILISVIHYYFGPLIEVSGFGRSRWFFALVDIALVPVAVPFLFFALFSVLRLFKDQADPAKFVLFSLIPAGVIRAVSWGAQSDPVYLILIPLLWTGLTLGISFFVRLAFTQTLLVVIPLVIAILLMPFAAATSFWAFYGQMTLVGVLLLAFVSIPAVIAVLLHRRS